MNIFQHLITSRLKVAQVKVVGGGGQHAHHVKIAYLGKMIEEDVIAQKTSLSWV